MCWDGPWCAVREWCRIIILCFTQVCGFRETRTSVSLREFLVIFYNTWTFFPCILLPVGIDTCCWLLITIFMPLFLSCGNLADMWTHSVHTCQTSPVLLLNAIWMYFENDDVSLEVNLRSIESPTKVGLGTLLQLQFMKHQIPTEFGMNNFVWTWDFWDWTCNVTPRQKPCSWVPGTDVTSKVRSLELDIEVA